MDDGVELLLGGDPEPRRSQCLRVEKSNVRPPWQAEVVTAKELPAGPPLLRRRRSPAGPAPPQRGARSGPDPPAGPARCALRASRRRGSPLLEWWLASPAQGAGARWARARTDPSTRRPSPSRGRASRG